MSEGRPSFISKLRNALVGTTVIAGTAMGVEATAHPIQNTIDTTKNAIEQGAHNVQQAKDELVSFYNKDAEIQKYNEEVSARLSGRKPLLEGEQIFEKVKIVAAGANYDERQKMIDEKAPINVREYPSTYTPTGHSTDVLGTLPQGTEILHAIRVNTVAPNSQKMGSWYGFLYRPAGAGESEPFKIGYIYGIYIQPETVNTAASDTLTNIP